MMSVYKYYLLIIGTLFLSSCSQESNPAHVEKQEEPIHYIDVIDTSRITIIPLSNVSWLKEADRQANLSILELHQIDSLLILAAEDYNANVKKEHEELMAFYRDDAEFMGTEFIERPFPEDNLIRDLSSYRRQYVPYYNNEGEKIVTVYCHCLSFSLGKWQYEVLQINDGGNCHFDVVINLTKKTYERVWVNGYA